MKLKTIKRLSLKKSKQLLFALFLFILFIHSPQEGFSQHIKFNFDEQTISDALVEVAKKMDVKIAFDAGNLKTIKITKYIHGPKYNPIEFKMAVQEVSSGNIVPTITRMMKMCFNYEPEGRNKQKAMTILGFILMISIGAILFILYPPLKNKS